MAEKILLTLLWSGFAFLCGALPFSVWVGKWGLRRDIRRFGDHNPGATNVLRAGGMPWFLAALLLDISKGAFPVGLATFIFGRQGWEMIPIALAPLLGHAFSPFLGWRGGKAIAAAFGVWIGLTLWPIPLVGMVSLATGALLIRPHGWAVVGALLAILAALLWWLPDPALLGVWMGHAPLLAWTHREDLSQRPQFRLRRQASEVSS